MRMLLKKLDLSQLHFCKADKVKYRKHLTVGTLLATGAGIAGVAFDVTIFVHVATVANCVTAIWWIWE